MQQAVLFSTRAVLKRRHCLLCRQYVSQEADLVAPAVLLDQFGSSGWALISALINGNRTARDLYNTNAFVNTSEY